jgi:hypothetical protein
MKIRLAFAFISMMMLMHIVPGGLSRAAKRMARPAAVIQGAYTPQPGSPERKAIMDAYRAVWMGGDQSRPVVFVVNYLKVRRGWAYTTVTPQSPDGSQNYETESGLLRKINGRWKVLDQAAGGGDESDVKRMRMKYPAAPPDIFP